MITPSFNLTSTERVLPKLALDFTTDSLDSRVTFTRTTNASNPATYVNSFGYVTAATDNQPRFDYNPVTLACNGLLIEESRANLLIRSEEFNTFWTKSNVTIGTDVAVSPSNTTTADKIEATTSAATFIYQSVTVNATSVSASVYIKKGSGATDANSFFIRNVTAATTLLSVTINYDTKEITYVVGSSGASLTDAGNGWLRLTLSPTTAITSGNSIRFGVCFIGGSETAGEYAYAWGAQLEAGAFATSYIPTTTTVLTRNADVATMTGTNFSDWYNAAKGTFRVDAISIANGTRPIISADDNSANNSLLIKTEGTAPTFVATQGGSEQASVAAGTITANTDMYAYVSYDSNYFGIARAASRQVDTSGTVPTVDRLRIGASQAGAYFNGIIKKIQFWN